MSSQGRKPAAIIAELEENLAEMKAKFLKREITEAEYTKAARPLALKISTMLREQIEQAGKSK